MQVGVVFIIFILPVKDNEKQSVVLCNCMKTCNTPVTGHTYLVRAHLIWGENSICLTVITV